MSESQSRLNRLFTELRRRHVVRAAIWYGLAVFGVLQAADIVLEAFAVSDQVLRLLVVLSVLGFPLVLALAWVYEITPGGIRTMAQLDGAIPDTQSYEVGHLTPRLALLAVTAVAVTGAATWWLRTEPTRVGSVGDSMPAEFVAAEGEPGDIPIRSVAVLPLQSYSPDSEREYFALGMHEALVSQLSQLGVARVISRTSVMAYDRTGKSMAQIGNELGVEGVVEGSVTVDGDSVKISVHLIHAPSDTDLFARDYVRELTGVIGLQNEVARAIALQVEGQISGDPPVELMASAEPMDDVEPMAVMEEMKGRMVLEEGGPENVDLAEGHFMTALRIDSTFPATLVGLAGVEIMRIEQDGLTEAGLQSAQRYVSQALAFDPDHFEALELADMLEDFEMRGVDGDAFVIRAPAGMDAPASVEVEVGEAQSGTAVDEDQARRTRVVFMTDTTAVRRSVSEWGRRIDAMLGRVLAGDASPRARLQAAGYMEASGDLEGAIDLLETSVESDPEVERAWDTLERLYVRRDDFDQVVALRVRREEALGAEEGFPDAANLQERLAVDPVDGYWRWRRDLLDAEEDAGRRVSSFDWATTYAALGEPDRAYEYLDRALERPDPQLLGSLRNDPVWDAYRRDEQFTEIMDRIRRPSRGDRPGFPRPPEAGRDPSGRPGGPVPSGS